MLVDHFARTARTRVRRLPKRGHYDRDTVHAVLDAGVLCHVGYVIDDQPYVTPTCHCAMAIACTGTARPPAGCCAISSRVCRPA
jgi:uncharacterized membrane protein